MAYDLTGREFGALTVIDQNGSRRGRYLWRCRCKCGNETFVTSDKLRSGSTKTCGQHPKGLKHGHTSRSAGSSPTYRCWANMVSRCTQPSTPDYARYGAKGISVCDGWRSFEAFLADMGERPSLAHSIDRHPNKSGNYEPGNCRWATKKQQSNNRVDNNIVVYRGTTMALADLARLVKVPYERLRHRIVRAGWSVEEAATASSQQGSRRDPI